MRTRFAVSLIMIQATPLPGILLFGWELVLELVLVSCAFQGVPQKFPDDAASRKAWRACLMEGARPNLDPCLR